MSIRATTGNCSFPFYFIHDEVLCFGGLFLFGISAKTMDLALTTPGPNFICLVKMFNIWPARKMWPSFVPTKWSLSGGTPEFAGGYWDAVLTSFVSNIRCCFFYVPF